jgi:hypothetical protein
VELIHATELTVSGLALDLAGTRLAFAMKAGPAALDTSSEIYSIGTDGTGNGNVTPAYFPTNFLVHQAIFARDERGLYFIAEWWD